MNLNLHYKCGGKRHALHKFLLVMKLIIILLTTAIMQVSASSYAQKITLNRANAPLSQIINDIRNQSGYDFLYNNKLLKTAHLVTINVKDASIDEVLAICFNNQPITYKVEDKAVLLKEKKEPSFLDKVADVFAVIDVHGRVVDEKGQSMIGVTVKLKDQNIVTTTDKDGYFFLKGVNENQMITFSFIGYSPKEINAKSDLGTIALEISSSKLDEIQIIAYGKTTERLSVGNVSTVSSKMISQQPVSNPLLALQAQVPGLVITQSTGLPGTGVSVNIQGLNSIANGNDPFYVIDGVPYTSQLLPNLGSILGGSGANNTGSYNSSGSPFSFINPNDIESISILKDASTTAIYGSRAANGAILITTKKGGIGSVKASINIQNGVGVVPHFLDLLSTSQFLEMRREALKNDGITSPSATDYDINGFWDQSRYTDWQKELIGGKAHYNNVNADFSGGSENTHFLFSTTYNKQTTVFPGDFNDQKASTHFNFNTVTPDKKVSFSFTGSYLFDDNNLLTTDLTTAALTVSPNAPALYNPDGSINWMPNSSGNSSWNNPISTLQRTYKNQTKNLVSNMVINYKILPTLSLQLNSGYTNMQADENIANPTSAIRPERRANVQRSAYYQNSSISSWIIEPQLHYKSEFSIGKFEALAGISFQENNGKALQLFGQGYSSDLVLNDASSAPSITVRSAISNIYKYDAIFGRVSYNLHEKYLLDLNARRDGSSRFGSNNTFHNFGSVGAGYIFTEEKIFKNHLSWFSFGKLKASYGTTGSDQISDYRYLNLYGAITTNIGVPYQGITAVAPLNLRNAYIQWEETRKINIGLDLGFLSDRLTLSGNFFRNRSSNQLLDAALPSTAGFITITQNLPATVENSGWELSINSVNIKKKNFSWTSSFNLTIAKNKLVSFPNLEKSAWANSLIVGQPTNFTKVFHYLGVNSTTGLYEFADKDGKATSNPDDLLDRTILINTQPKFYGGIQNTVKFKNLELDFLIQFVKQIGHNYEFGNYIPGTSLGYLGNQPTSVLNRWQTVGDSKPIQRFNSDGAVADQSGYANSSDAAYSDASYLRLKNLQLSWSLPVKFNKVTHLKYSRIYFQGENLVTITHFKGLDPETQGIYSLPTLRVLTIGLQAGF